MCGRFIKAISGAAQKGVLTLIHGYRSLIKPFWGNRCRFYPSCSEYALTAIKEFGTMRGSYYIIKRLLRCHPFHPGGYDPLPQKIKVEKK